MLKNFVRQPKKTFSTVSANSGRDSTICHQRCGWLGALELEACRMTLFAAADQVQS
jgi:hypothetical protein